MHSTPALALQQSALSPAVQRPPMLEQPPLGGRHTRGEEGSVGDDGKQLPSQQSLPVLQLAPAARHGASAQNARWHGCAATIDWLTRVNGGWLGSIPTGVPGVMAVTQSFFGPLSVGYASCLRLANTTQ
jgi:hypothetical protein